MGIHCIGYFVCYFIKSFVSYLVLNNIYDFWAECGGGSRQGLLRPLLGLSLGMDYLEEAGVHIWPLLEQFEFRPLAVEVRCEYVSLTGAHGQDCEPLN